MNIDEWFPNFGLFVLTILPALIILTIIMIMVTYWINRKKRMEKDPMDWMEIFKWATLIYLLVPIFRIVSYFEGELPFDELIEGLMVTDFRNYMILALITGLMGLLLILKNKILQTWGVRLDE